MTFWWTHTHHHGTTTPTDTSDNDFDAPGADNLIGLWDFNDGAKTSDTGLADGIAQNGHLHGGASISDGALRLDGSHDYFDVSGADAPFDLSAGTVMVEFTQDDHVGSSPDVLVNRGEYCDRNAEGYFNIQVTCYGQVQVNHYDGGQSVQLSTATGFFNEGDDVRVAYSWDETTGGTMVVENVTTGASFTEEHDVTGLSLDVGDNDDENFTFGAREVDDGDYDQFFKGDINYVAIFDQDVVNSGDGIVSGTTGDDLIDLAYTGDPDGDMVDNGDAILPGEAANDDIIQAGAGDDTILGGEGDDEIYGDTGTSNVEMERESFNWNHIADTNGGGGNVDDEESLNSQTITQDTGNVTVTVTTPTVTTDSSGWWHHHSDDSVGVESSFETDDVVISGIDGDGTVVNDNSSLASLAEEGETGTYNIEFSDTVENVDFRISDIDANRGQVTIRAYDADGNAIDVDLTAGSNLDLTNTDSVAGNDTATSANTADVDPNATSNSVLVQIAGPVARVEVIHTNVGSGLSGINISDIYYDAPTGVVVDGAGDDLINGGVGADAIFGEGGDDTIQLTDAFGDDTIVGGETGETDGDTLDATGVTTDTSVVFSDPETGTITSGADDADFAEIENVLLGSGDDTVTGSNGDDAVDLGQGEDVADMGAGDDTIGLGTDGAGNPDGDADVVVFSDNDGDDTITDFDTPITNPDGTLTGIDTLDVSGLNNASGDPVNVSDVTVTQNPDGDAVLTFPNGESLTLVGVPASEVTTPEQLEAIGIPGLPLDGIVSGTAGGDLIDTAYTGDPDGDMVDAGDAIIAGEAPNDDIIQAGAGDDTILAGLGDDDITAGSGDDVITGGAGDDLIDGESGDDTILGFDGTDTVIGGETGETDGDTLDLSSETADVSVDLTDAEEGTATNGTDTIEFSEIENIQLGSGDDTVTGSDGDDAIDLGEGEDVADLGAGDDTVGLGKDTDGTPDGDADVVIFSDGDGDDTILDFDAPITNPDGSLTGIDTLDVSGLNDADGNPVNVADVTTTENPDGDAVLTFPNGESLTLVGIPAADVTTPEQLEAIGIPGLPLDGIVDGTAGDDLIDAGYLGDPEGDMVDAGDAILPGEAPNDDIIEAGDGNDTILAGLGDDEAYGRDGDDEIFGEEGDDYLSGGEGDDLLVGGAGNDTLDAGQGVDTLEGGEGDDLLLGGPTTDLLDGGTGNDTMNGGNNADTIYGGDGNDVANGEFGDDFIDVSGSNPILDNPPIPGIPADGTPNDDRDYVDGGEGNDTILTGDDADTIFGGAGNDNIDAGIDDDYIDGGDGDDTIDGSIGNDTIFGGAGNDSIIAGIDAASDYVGDDPLFPAGDPNQNDGRDYVDAGEGDDYVFTGDDRDTILGGDGNDTIHAGIDDDTVIGGAGNDDIIGGHGSDYIEGGDGDDVINAGDSALLYGQAPDATDPVPTNGMDTVDGGAGNDYIEGQDDDDLLMGGTGNDTIDGGIDEDTILGGEGDDLIIGGQGADDLQGGTGDDTFDGATAGDVVLGGEDADGNDTDTLDLRGSGAIRINYNPTDSEAGTVEFLDGVGGPVTGTMTFSEIENVIPCFTPGTSIATPKGERLVEELQVGDKVITRDNGIQEIRWLGAKDMDWKQLALNPHLKPILVRAGSLGNGLPERDMMVSPNHRLLVANDKTALYFEEREVLAAAKHLVNNRGIHEVETMGTQYIHFMFDNHEVVLSNGAWTESFQPGDYTLEGIGNAQRNEILELFPELKTAQGIEAYQSARRTLKKHEARLLVD